MTMFNIVLIAVAVIAVIVFVSLYFVDAGYGKMISPKWGPTIPNKIGWCLMECPVFIVMLVLWATSEVKFSLPYLVFFLLFELHYFHRSFVFPFLLKGKSRMPIAIMLLSICFNLTNGFIQGWWLFRIAPAEGYYCGAAWFKTFPFIAGVILFIAGMYINRQSDWIIRHLRKPGDTKHYLPKGGFYNYVTSANYFGEIVEWLGWAALTWSWAGFIFFIFTSANLVPRANSIYHRYEKEFPDEFPQRKLKRVFPFIY